MSITLTTNDGKVDHVSGMATNGLDNVCRALMSQGHIDGQPWTSLIVKNSSGKPLRVLSPNNATVMGGNIFQGYMDTYVNQVYDNYTNQPLNIDTQAEWGRVSGTVSNNTFNFGGQTFTRQNTADIFSCSTGPFGSNLTPEKLAIIPRLSAAFNRGTLLSSNVSPDPAGPTTYYKNALCNHYARIVHEQCLDGRGYAFPYDDVCQDGGPDQCGAVYDGQPKVLTIAVGGNAAYVSTDAYGAPMYN